MGQLDVDVIGMVMGCWWIDGGLPILGLPLPLPLPLPLQRGRLPHPDRAPLRSVRAPFSGSGHRSPVPCVPDPKRPLFKSRGRAHEAQVHWKFLPEFCIISARVSVSVQLSLLGF